MASLTTIVKHFPNNNTNCRIKKQNKVVKMENIVRGGVCDDMTSTPFSSTSQITTPQNPQLIIQSSSLLHHQKATIPSQNIRLTDKDVEKLLKAFGVCEPHDDLDIYQTAFVHRSYLAKKFTHSNNNSSLTHCVSMENFSLSASYERLEFLGDAILNAVMADYLYERYPLENEGFLTRMRTKLVNGKMLSQLSMRVGLQKFMLLAPAVEDQGSRQNPRLLEDIFEAFVGAIFLDLGFECAKKWIVNVTELYIDYADLVNQLFEN